MPLLFMQMYSDDCRRRCIRLPKIGSSPPGCDIPNGMHCFIALRSAISVPDTLKSQVALSKQSRVLQPDSCVSAFSFMSV